MAVLRMECAWQIDSNAPTDRLIITPHFKDVNIPFTDTDTQNLCNDLATGLDNWAVTKTQLTVKAYDAQAPKPNYPKATAIKNSGTILTASSNRDLALCLSFYGTVNHPRTRGRLYIPACIPAIAATTAFAQTAAITKVAALVPLFTGLGGIDVDWVVFSRADNTSHPITNWFIDNSWDTQRRRGPRATTRTVGTTTEDQAPNVLSLVAGVPASDLDEWPTDSDES